MTGRFFSHIKINAGTYITLVFNLLLVLFFYSNVVFSPNSYISSKEADGLKNYFNISYHIKYDKDYMSFGGMNYPYGESILFVDCHPILANLLKFFSDNLIDISDNTVGILNWLMLLSLVLSPLLLFHILQHYGLKRWMSYLGATAIGWLSSQVLLWYHGHYALSHAVFFPLGWYLLIQYFKSDQKMKWSALIALNTIFWFFIHVYLGFILVAFTFWVLVVDMLRDVKVKGKQSSTYLALSIQGVLPVLVLFVSVLVFDDHEGRYEWPFISDYRASTWSMLYPQNSYLKGLYDWFLDLFGFTVPADQSWLAIGNYIGLPATIAGFGYLIYLIRSAFKKQFQRLKDVVNHELFPYLISSLVLLVFAFAIPFHYCCQGMLDVIPPLKQFIGLGRFGWAFYYVIGVCTFVMLHKLMSRKWAPRLIAVAGIVMVIEGTAYHSYISRTCFQSKNIFVSDRSKNARQLDSDPRNFYHAIVPLPFYYKWNTPYKYGGTLKSEEISMRFSYTTGLPLMSAFLARPSLTEGQHIIQVFAPTYTDKPLRQQLSPDKKLLVLNTKDQLGPFEKYFLAKCQPLSDQGAYATLEIDMANLFDGGKEQLLNEFNYAQQNFSIEPISGYYQQNVGDVIFYNNFDFPVSKITYRGAGAFQGAKDKMHTIYHSKPNTFQVGQQYVVSFWYYNRANRHDYCDMFLEELQSNGSILWQHQFFPYSSVLYDKDWAFNEFTFYVKDSANTIRIRSAGLDKLDNQIFVDELLVRKAGANVYRFYENGQALDKNNIDVMRK